MITYRIFGLPLYFENYPLPMHNQQLGCIYLFTDFDVCSRNIQLSFATILNQRVRLKLDKSGILHPVRKSLLNMSNAGEIVPNNWCLEGPTGNNFEATRIRMDIALERENPQNVMVSLIWDFFVFISDDAKTKDFMLCQKVYEKTAVSWRP